MARDEGAERREGERGCEEKRVWSDLVRDGWPSMGLIRAPAKECGRFPESTRRVAASGRYHVRY
jgi:hypothetical protein